MKKRGKYYALVLSSTAVLSGLAVGTSAETQAQAAINEEVQSTRSASTAVEAVTQVDAKTAIAAQLAAKGVDYENLTAEQADDMYVDVIVQLAEQPAAENGTLVKNYSSTAEIQQESEKVIAKQAKLKDQVRAITHQGVGESYGYVVNGFSTKVKVKDLDKLKRLSGVKAVTVAKVYYTTEVHANSMANVQTVWSNYKYKGEQTVVSVIDTGIDPNHKDMRLSDEKNVKLTEEDVESFTEEVGHGAYFTPKVPYGYNYADGNSRFVYDDDPVEQHGMHVAGIIGANGTGSDSTSSVVGVAPEAQLLAMKVFTNSDTSATTGTDTVVAAIEDSAKIGADVLNMSLGSTAGYQTLEDPEIAAVRNATEAGTAAVISAGNAGTTNSLTDGTSVDYFGGDPVASDMATVGSPGTARDALTVASAENVTTTNPVLTLSSDGEVILDQEIVQLSPQADTNVFDGKKFYVARDAAGNVGLGKPEDYTDDVKGKVAVVKRGDLAFTEKQANAKAAGAVGLIIVDNKGDITEDTPLTSIQLDPTLSTFGLSTKDGASLITYLENNPSAVFTAKFTAKESDNVLYDADKMSTFTSYGPTPDLSFKPDITAPGGQIWSTQNNDSYTNMSGTSMAAPFTAGSQALLMQAIKNKDNPFYEQYQKMSGSELTMFLKAIQMNTAKPINDDKYDNAIVSPRRQGAGLLDVDAAITALETNPTTVVSQEGYPAVELRSFNTKEKAFTLTFTNRTDKSLTYHMEENEDTDAIYTSATDPKSAALYDKKIEGASITGENPEIVVPAGESVSATFTLQLPDGFKENQYVEGYLNFAASDGTSLNMPYMGYYGNWDKLPIFDNLVDNVYTGFTQLIGSDGVQMGYDFASQEVLPEAIAFSPTEDSARASFEGQFYTFRNARDIKIEILDEKGNVVAQPSEYASAEKAYWYANEGRWVLPTFSGWDGSLYNQETGEYEVAPDGQYTYRVSALPDQGSERQTIEIPVKVDTQAPELRGFDLVAQTTDKGTQYYLTAEAKDTFSGLDINQFAATMVNGVLYQGTYEVIGKAEEGFTKVRVPLSEEQAATLAAGNNNLELYVEDNAANYADELGKAQKPGEVSFGLVLDGPQLPEVLSEANDAVEPNEDGTYSYTISGSYPHELFGTYVDKNGDVQSLEVKYDADQQNFVVNVPLDAADYALSVNLYTDAAHQHPVKELKTQVQLAQPTVTFTIDNGATGTSEDHVTVTGTVSEDVTNVTVVNGDQTVEATVEDGKFTATVPIVNGDNELSVVVTDADGNETTSEQTVKSTTKDKDPLTNAFTFTNGVKLGANYVFSDTPYYDAESGTVTVEGTLKHNYQEFEIIDASGKNYVERSADGTSFTAVLPVGQVGQKPFTIVLNDSYYEINSYQEALSFSLDVVLPTLTLDNPTEEPVYTSDPTYTLSGTVSDNLKYLDLYVNGDNIKTSWGDVSFNDSEGNKQTFTQDVQLKEGKNVLEVGVADYMGNVVYQTVVVYYEPQTSRDAAKAELTALVDKTKAIDGVYTEESLSALAEALTAAEAVLADPDATLASIAESQSALQTAFDGLVVKPEATEDPLADAKAALIALVESAQKQEGEYTADSAAILQQALEAAKTVIAKEGATEEEYATAQTTLQAAIDGLVLQSTADAQAIQAIRAELEQLAAQAEQTVAQAADYTPETASALSRALATAKALLADPASTAEELTNAKTALEQALASLVEKPTEPTEPSDSTEPTEPSESAEPTEPTEPSNTASSEDEPVTTPSSTDEDAEGKVGTTPTTDPENKTPKAGAEGDNEAGNTGDSSTDSSDVGTGVSSDVNNGSGNHSGKTTAPKAQVPSNGNNTNIAVTSDTGGKKLPKLSDAIENNLVTAGIVALLTSVFGFFTLRKKNKKTSDKN
ncbi:S8 family serine peptidase [Enterococcus mediterraneensis]|uniref:S8 family serine peptidase n=1 Tax=Enterococcus mediterraneensis TaxID=2364791 RepID=UPI000F0508F1|nr:S8 family serine peptidase [Enterococcus mediterraneensis]